MAVRSLWIYYKMLRHLSIKISHVYFKNQSQSKVIIYDVKVYVAFPTDLTKVVNIFPYFNSTSKIPFWQRLEFHIFHTEFIKYQLTILHIQQCCLRCLQLVTALLVDVPKNVLLHLIDVSKSFEISTFFVWYYYFLLLTLQLLLSYFDITTLFPLTVPTLFSFMRFLLSSFDMTTLFL